MQRRPPTPPIIFIGMHRSGTTMLGRLLEQLGLFVGARKESNNEALFFLRLNEWLMSQCGARWDNPGPIRYLWENEELLQWIERHVRDLMASPRAIQFLGLRRYLRTRDIARLDCPWGWKDPRNSFTLPFWLRIFPGAKVIHIRRHGVDVAQSLRARNTKRFMASKEKYARYHWVAAIRMKRGGFAESPRCATLEGGLSLWKEYIDHAKELLYALPQNRVLDLHYEDILRSPARNLKLAGEFCGLQFSETDVAAATAGIDPSRAFAFSHNNALANFASSHCELLEFHGYTDEAKK